ncbi:hypothetical protein [Streptomyces justiciae]|uniref:Uncharacterized protein n=1 Tax=Streptomyces justiciae TaxID=2780140 RepID=A0ABU3M801_9ACTN|nr:hypothetical protein [Streptomyces justiciae]MDT7847634.1 hypothetical protein [Streptomyces justiciae]
MERDEAHRLLDEYVGYGRPARALLMEQAEARRLTPELLGQHVTSPEGGTPDLPAMIRALRRAGLGAPL